MWLCEFVEGAVTFGHRNGRSLILHRPHRRRWAWHRQPVMYQISLLTPN